MLHLRLRNRLASLGPFLEKTAGRDTRLTATRDAAQALLPAYADHRLGMRTDTTAHGLLFGKHLRISGRVVTPLGVEDDRPPRVLSAFRLLLSTGGKIGRQFWPFPPRSGPGACHWASLPPWLHCNQKSHLGWQGTTCSSVSMMPPQRVQRRVRFTPPPWLHEMAVVRNTRQPLARHCGVGHAKAMMR